MLSEKLNIFFDLDGTLLEISERYYQIYKKIVNELNGTPLPKKDYWVLKRDKASTAKILKLSHLSEDNFQNFNFSFISKIEQLEYLQLDRVNPYAIKILEELYGNELFLFTFRHSKRNTFIELDRLNLKKYFKNIFMDSLCKDKSLLIPERMHNTHGVIVGDSEADINAAHKLGFFSIGMTMGIRNEKFLSQVNPSVTLNKLSSIPFILKTKYKNQLL